MVLACDTKELKSIILKLQKIMPKRSLLSAIKISYENGCVVFMVRSNDTVIKVKSTTSEVTSSDHNDIILGDLYELKSVVENVIQISSKVHIKPADDEKSVLLCDKEGKVLSTLSSCGTGDPFVMNMPSKSDKNMLCSASLIKDIFDSMKIIKKGDIDYGIFIDFKNNQVVRYNKYSVSYRNFDSNGHTDILQLKNSGEVFKTYKLMSRDCLIYWNDEWVTFSCDNVMVSYSLGYYGNMFSQVYDFREADCNWKVECNKDLLITYLTSEIDDVLKKDTYNGRVLPIKYDAPAQELVFNGKMHFPINHILSKDSGEFAVDYDKFMGILQSMKYPTIIISHSSKVYGYIITDGVDQSYFLCGVSLSADSGKK